MSKTPTNVRKLSRAAYEIALRLAVRDKPRAELPPSERPLPPAVMAMTADQYAAAKKAAVRG